MKLTDKGWVMNQMKNPYTPRIEGGVNTLYELYFSPQVMNVESLYLRYMLVPPISYFKQRTGNGCFLTYNEVINGGY